MLCGRYTPSERSDLGRQYKMMVTFDLMDLVFEYVILSRK